MNRPVSFWRPLYRIAVPLLQTLLWKHEWANHMICSAAHGVTAMLVWLLLTRLGMTRLAAAAGGMIFALYPVHFEVFFWPATLPTSLSTSTTLLALLVAISHARGQTGTWGVFAVGALTFTAACWNEQPACLSAAIPFIYLGQRRSGEPLVRLLGRSLPSTLIALAALIAYVVAHRAQGIRPPAIGHDSMIVPLDEIWKWTRFYAYWGRGRLLLHDFNRPATVEGLTCLARHPLAAWAFGIPIALSAPAWLIWQRALGDGRAVGTAAPLVLPLVVTAIAMLAGPLVPVIAFGYGPMPRLVYAPMVGIALLFAMAIDIASRHWRSEAHTGTRWRTLTAAVQVALALWFILMLVGVQSMFQKRSRQDLEEVAQLRAMIPDPVPGSVFAPVRVEPPPSIPGAAGFGKWFTGTMHSRWWSAQWIIRHAYRRADLDCGRCYWWEDGFEAVNARGVRVREVGFVPWEKVIPFEIDPSGKVNLVNQIIVEGVDGSRRTFDVPQVVGLALPPAPETLPPRPFVQQSR